MGTLWDRDRYVYFAECEKCDQGTAFYQEYWPDEGEMRLKQMIWRAGHVCEQA